MKVLNSKKIISVESKITEVVVNRILENFPEHYFQMVMIDLIEIINKSDLNPINTVPKYGYLVGVSADMLFKFLTEYLENDEIIEHSCIQEDVVMDRLYSSIIRDIINSKRFDNTLNNFIEFEKKKYGLDENSSVDNESDDSKIQWIEE